MIKIQNLFFQYPNTSHGILNDISVSIAPGTLTVVTGASGSGKSTFLRCINGLVPHFSGGKIKGTIDVFGHNPTAEGPKIMAPEVGFVFQEPESQFVYQQVEDEIAFILENLGVPKAEMHQQVNMVLKTLGIDDIREENLNSISGGEKQLVAIASALVAHPKILILDEPTSQLDPVSAARVLNHLLRIKEKMGLTVLISEHRLERLLGYADHIAYLSLDGTLKFGSPQHVLPMMDQVPPVIRIARRLGLSPLPLTPKALDRHRLTDSCPSRVTEKRSSNQFPKREKSTQAIRLASFSVNYQDKAVINNLDFTLYKGEILTLTGPNGAGKTTLLRAILGLIPAQGYRSFFGRDMSEIGFSELIRSIAYLPQNPNDLLFAETVRQELEITLKNHDLPIQTIFLTQFLEDFDLANKQDRYPRDLSVGERQRTALAAITVHKPQVILLDEPTRGMDYRNKQSLAKNLKKWRDNGVAVLLVTHDIEFAATLSDRVAILEQGERQFDGSPYIAFTQFPQYRTQTATLFPDMNWIVPDDIP